MQEEQTDFKPKSLDDVLTAPAEDTPPEEAQPEAAPGPEAEPAKDTEQKADEPEKQPDKAGDKEPDGSPPPETPSKDTDEPTVPRSALLAERKRYKGEISQLESRLSSIEQKQARPDPDIDPDGAADFDRKQQSASEFRSRTLMSQEIMREIHSDYDEVEAVFLEEAASNPALQAKLSQSAFPAKLAYTEGKRLQTLKEMGDDPEGYIEKVRQEAAEAARATVLEELKKHQDESAKASIPESLAEAPSASRKESKTWGGPKPMNEIIG